MSASVARPAKMSADEFLAWSRQRPGRFELERGEVVGMAAERLAHALLKTLAFDSLRAAIRTAGLPCQALPAGMAVRIDESTVYEPDSLVRCGPALPLDTAVIMDPMIVVEVLSPSTGAIDTGGKLDGYFRVATIQHYLILSVMTRSVTHHRRAEGGDIASRIVRAGALDLRPPGLLVEGLFEPLDGAGGSA